MTWHRLALQVLGRKHRFGGLWPISLGDIRVDRMLQVDDGEVGDTYKFGILGPLTATRGGVPLRLGTPQQRAVLAVLVCHASRVVTRERLVDALWGDAPRHAALTSIRAHVSHLRQVLEPDHEPGTAYRVLVTESSGYRLVVPEANVDASRFESLAEEGRSKLEAGDARAAVAAFDAALSLWRGEVLVDLPRYSFISGVAIPLDELCAVVQEGRVEALLELGRTTAALAEIDRMLDRHPLREGVTGQRMVALYRAGRQSEALEAYRNLRKRLNDELGIEPSPSLADLHRRILQHDPTLLNRSANHPEPAAADRGSITTAAAMAAPQPAPEVSTTPALPSPVTPWRPGNRSRRVLASAVVAMGLGGVVLGTGGATSPTVELTGNAVGVLDPSGRVLDALPAGTNPSGVAFAGGSLWVANQGDNTVLRIHPDTSAVLQRWEAGDSPSAIVATETDVWVANAGDATVTRINIAANRIVQPRISVGSRPEALAVGPGGIWVANSGDNTIQRIDQKSGDPAAPVDVGDGPDGLLVDGNALWVANGRDGTVSRRDATTGNELGSPTQVGSGPRGMARFGDELWVADQLSRSVSRVDLRSGSVHSLLVGDGPTSLAALSDAVWVSEQYAGTLTRIDPATNALTTVPVGGAPLAVMPRRDGIWVSVAATATSEHRGGTLTIAAAAPPGTAASGIDPAEVYEITTGWANRLVYDGLVSLRYADGQDVQALVPSLATRLPRPSDGGRTYTFELRKGIRYSTGAEVVASDFLRGVRRAILHAGRALYHGIVGADACIDPDHCDLAGVQVDDTTGRVSFHLSEPDPDFVYRLVLLVYPTPAAYTEESSAPMPGVGPYQISEYQSGLKYTLTRNPYFTPWSVAASPPGYPDVITWRKVTDIKAAVAAVDAGQADLAELTPLGPRSQTREVVDDVSIRQPTQIRRSGPTGTSFVALNSSVPPFDNVLVRRALNFAVDRGKIVERVGGPLTADPSCQVIPPGFPGYHSYCPYTVNAGDGAYHGPDLATARRLVADSGTFGASVTVTDLVGDINPPFDDYIAEVLTDLGYHVIVDRLAFTDANREHFNDPHGGVQVASGGWLPDYPRASTYYDPLFRCPAIYQAYVFGYCDPEIDRAADAALALQATDPGRANREWAAVQQRVVDGAPAVFGVTTRDVWYTSERIGNYQQAEIYGPLFSQIWVR